MSDKIRLIKQEIERLKHTSNAYDRSRFMLLLEIEEFIDSLPKESGCEVNFTTKSEDLEEAANFYANTHIEWFDSEGNPCVMPAFKAGAEWQKNQMKEVLQTEYEKGRFDMREEMMKDAVELEVCDNGCEKGLQFLPVYQLHYEYIDGDKVKIIIIKEK